MFISLICVVTLLSLGCFMLVLIFVFRLPFEPLCGADANTLAACYGGRVRGRDVKNEIEMGLEVGIICEREWNKQNYAHCTAHICTRAYKKHIYYLLKIEMEEFFVADVVFGGRRIVFNATVMSCPLNNLFKCRRRKIHWINRETFRTELAMKFVLLLTPASTMCSHCVYTFFISVYRCSDAIHTTTRVLRIVVAVVVVSSVWVCVSTVCV